MAYNLKTHKSGDTFDGVSFTITVNSSPLDLTGASIEMTVFSQGNGLKQVKKFTVGNGLTITSPASGQFEIDEQVIDLTPNTYYYEIEFTLQDGSVKTYVCGEWRITKKANC